MLAQLEVIAGADRGRVFPLTPGEPLVIGRGRQTATRLNDPHVSRVHCRVEFRGDVLVLTDLNSAGGTFVNDRPVAEQELRPGDVIGVGETRLCLRCEDLADQNTLPPDRPAPFPVNLSLDQPPPRPAGVPVVRVTSAGPPTVELPLAIPIPDEPAAGEGIPEVLPAALPVAEPLPESLPAAVPIPAAPPAARPRTSVLKVLPGERLGELTGSVLAHFAVGDVVARGKSGVVFRARDLDRGADVALKVLRPEITRDDTEVQRFIRSMKTMLPLRHPNLVSLFGAGKKGPYCWVAMEFVDGESLAQVIQRIGVAGMLDWRHAFRVAVHIGRALEFAHTNAVVHRNLTPQNVLIRAADKVAKLGDLMLAKAIEGGMAQQITQANEVLGDLRFLSPEQTFGPDRMDGRSDLYSLGALLYAALTGQPPVEAGGLVETILRIRTAPVEMPKKFQMSIPDAFQAVVLRLLAKRPEDRYQTATDLLSELERVARFQGITL